MKKFVVVLALACLFCVPVSAQKRPAKAMQSRTYCQGDKIPAGYVIVGMKPSQKCESKPELDIKKPAESETVCEGSPVPAGYTVTGTTGNVVCYGASPNPLTNALLISKEGAATSARVAARPTRGKARSDDEDEPLLSVVISNGEQANRRPKTAQEIADERADEINRQARRSNAMSDAISKNSIILGMTAEQVLKSWGLPSRVERSTSSSRGKSETWWYRLPEGTAWIEFVEGKVSYFHANW